MNCCLRSKYEMKAIVILLGVVSAAMGVYLIPYGFQLADMETRAMKGELLPFEIDPQKPIEIQIGGIHVITDMNGLSEGFNLRQIIDLGFDYPFQIKLKDRKLLFSVDIRNANNETIATIAENQWGVKNDNTIAHDRNYNSYALEVIDSHLLPVIQIIFNPENKLYVGGLFYVSNGIMLATNDTTIFNPSPADINGSLPRIFNYPSEQHLGEMVVKSTYQVSRASSQVIIIGVILTALGVFLVPYGFTISEKRRRHGKSQRQYHKGEQQNRTQKCNEDKSTTKTQRRKS